MACRKIVLDAKGVLYRHGQDVEELLVPYAREHGSTNSPQRIQELYLHASLGRITSAQLWAALGIAPAGADADYCARHELNAGVIDLLQAAQGARFACLSNDVSEWSALVRRRFEIEEAFDAWIVSGDIGLRKPDPRIYARAARELDADGTEVLFVDDRPPNLDAAAERGWITVRYGAPCGGHPCARDFSELRTLIEAHE